MGGAGEAGSGVDFKPSASEAPAQCPRDGSCGAFASHTRGRLERGRRRRFGIGGGESFR